MTTMNFDEQRIQRRRRRIRQRRRRDVETDFPHSATIYFDVRPTGVVGTVNGRTVTLSQNGESHHRQPQPVAGLPTIEASGES